MSYNATLIPGDGIGPEVVSAAQLVLEATGIRFSWDVHNVGQQAYQLSGDPLPPSVLASIRNNQIALKGPVSTRVAGTGFRSVNIALRRELGLFAQARPCLSMAGGHPHSPDVDLVVIRETTEDLYAGIEFEAGSEAATHLLRCIRDDGHRLNEDVGFSIKPTSGAATRKVMEFTIRYARQANRRKITVVHKASVMRCTDGLFLQVAGEVALSAPDLEFDDCLVDNFVARLVRRPSDFDVVVMPNMYGDIISDLAAALIGGVGLAPGANYGEDLAIFEAAHGSAPRHAGFNRANPAALILSGAMMLRHLGELEAAKRVELGVAEVVKAGAFVTYDLACGKDGHNGRSTREFAEAVVRRL
jgi:isocitrate dehydrogenase (NAD+)